MRDLKFLKKNFAQKILLQQMMRGTIWMVFEMKYVGHEMNLLAMLYNSVEVKQVEKEDMIPCSNTE
jgi:hypothetical protein